MVGDRQPLVQDAGGHISGQLVQIFRLKSGKDLGEKTRSPLVGWISSDHQVVI